MIGILVCVWAAFLLLATVLVSLVPETQLSMYAILGIVFGVMTVVFSVGSMGKGRDTLMLVAVALGLLSLPFVLYVSALEARQRGDVGAADQYLRAMYIHLAVYAAIGFIVMSRQIGSNK